MVINKAHNVSMATLIVTGASPELDKIVDVVLSCPPKPKSRAAKKLRRKATKKAKGASE